MRTCLKLKKLISIPNDPTPNKIYTVIPKNPSISQLLFSIFINEVIPFFYPEQQKYIINKLTVNNKNGHPLVVCLNRITVIKEGEK